MIMKITSENLNSIMEFGHVIMVSADGSVSDSTGNMPEVLYVTDGQDPSDVPDGWELLTGYTGQHGYRGPIMHPSEFIGGRLADDILSTPGYYVAVVVDDDADDDAESVGWAVARKDLELS